MRTFVRTKPYNDLPLVPPAARLETEPVLKAAIRASRSLAELKGRTRTMPNPAILLNTIALQEARASSEIENIFTTSDELYRGLSAESPDISPHAKEVLHYNEALWHGARALRERPRLTAALAIEIGGMIKPEDRGLRRQPGANLINRATGEIVYTPPDGEARIRKLLANLERFINAGEDGLDPLVKLAVIHYQFEAIHPFRDGNGRTGRILLILYLLQQRLLEQPILFLSRYIIEHKKLYYEHLRDVTERGAWVPWILYVLRAVESTAETTVLRIESIGELLARMIDEARLKLPKRTFSKELIEQLFVRPYCKIRHLEEAGLGNRVSSSRYLHDLAEAGLVAKTKSGKEILFVNERLVKLLAN
ncbi:MAG TPA: Fic/DOC family N-terminal domain-containing protein [Chthoniobacteraceae bacterium]|nr:Fic/DOC family N-terminal domain-containing protein [Chthoniobacteraceae bacterium]